MSSLVYPEDCRIVQIFNIRRLIDFCVKLACSSSRLVLENARVVCPPIFCRIYATMSLKLASFYFLSVPETFSFQQSKTAMHCVRSPPTQADGVIVCDFRLPVALAEALRCLMSLVLAGLLFSFSIVNCTRPESDEQASYAGRRDMLLPIFCSLLGSVATMLGILHSRGALYESLSSTNTVCSCMPRCH